MAPIKSAVGATSLQPADGGEGLASDLDEEFRRGIEDLENGDYIDLTPEQLARCVATGESPWPDESRG